MLARPPKKFPIDFADDPMGSGLSPSEGKDSEPNISFEEHGDQI